MYSAPSGGPRDPFPSSGCPGSLGVTNGSPGGHSGGANEANKEPYPSSGCPASLGATNGNRGGHSNGSNRAHNSNQQVREQPQRTPLLVLHPGGAGGGSSSSTRNNGTGISPRRRPYDVDMETKTESSSDLGSSSCSRSSSSESEGDFDTDSDSDSDNGDGIGSRSIPSRRSSAEDGGPLLPAATIMIFDWDDTLLPSTWIREQGLRLDSQSVPTEEHQARLARVSKCVAQTLRIASKYGEVVLVTNAESGWIELSCRKFFPSLCPLLDGIRLVSARTTYEAQGITSPFEWKFLAFDSEVRRFYEHTPDGIRKNVISYGDSAHEREALIGVTQRLHNCCTKSLKFVERPEPEQLLKEHELMSGCIRQVARHNGDLDLCIACS